MTFTADALRDIIGEDTGAAFAKKTGISQPNISRYLSGDNRIDATCLALVLKTVADPAQKSALITAWIRDQIPGELGHEIEVNIVSSKPTPARRLPKLSPKTEELLRYWWREAANDPQVGVTLGALRALRN